MERLKLQTETTKELTQKDYEEYKKEKIEVKNLVKKAKAKVWIDFGEKMKIT